MVAGMLVSEPGAMDEMMKDVPIRRLGRQRRDRGSRLLFFGFAAQARAL
jgi:hypothetical protein